MAAEASAGLIQPKAIWAAEAEDVLIEVAAIGLSRGDDDRRICPRARRVPRAGPSGCASPCSAAARSAAGCWRICAQRPDLFEVSPVLVRHPASGTTRTPCSPNLAAEALAGRPDLVVEAMGGADFPADLMLAALRWGAQVVTANKAAVAKHYDSLHACADASGGGLFYSAAVGGGAPILETLARLEGQVVAVEGVMNGTANYLLSRLGEGWSFDAALKGAGAGLRRGRSERRRRRP